MKNPAGRDPTGQRTKPLGDIMTDQIPTSEVLNRAADLIEERGWGQGPASMYADEDVCAMGALHLVAFGVNAREVDDPYGAVHLCPAGQAVYNYLEGRPQLWSGSDRIWTWNDDCESATEVIEVLRACALIEAAKENADEREPVSA